MLARLGAGPSANIWSVTSTVVSSSPAVMLAVSR